MKVGAVAAVLLMTIGCTASVSKTVQKSPVASASRDAGLPTSGSPVASTTDMPLSTASFACRLPVTQSTAGGDYATFTGGFVTFPAATLQSDPTGGMHSRYTEGGFATDQAPILYGSPQAGPPFYDAAQHRWVPASAPQSTADGAFYAYGSGLALTKEEAGIHVVDVAHATEKTFTSTALGVGPTKAFLVADFDASGVYFQIMQSDGSMKGGVRLLNPTTGDVRALAQVTSVMSVRGGFAWVGRVNPSDTSPPHGVASRDLYNSIVRVDLRNGSETAWYYKPGHSVVLRGLDSQDRPVVSVATGPDYPIDTSEIRLIDTPGGSGTLVYDGGGHSGTWSPEALWITGPQADGDRLWFGSSRGLFLYAPAGGFRKVFALGTPSPGVDTAILPAGFCR
jgi:hypothetical protein